MSATSTPRHEVESWWAHNRQKHLPCGRFSALVRAGAMSRRYVGTARRGRAIYARRRGNMRGHMNCSLLSMARLCYKYPHCGYGLVVEHVLAKDGIGVRFPVSAPNKFVTNEV